MERMAKLGWTNCYDIMEVYGEKDFNNQEEIDNYLIQKFIENDGDTVLDFYIDTISSHTKVEAEFMRQNSVIKIKNFVDV